MPFLLNRLINIAYYDSPRIEIIITCELSKYICHYYDLPRLKIFFTNELTKPCKGNDMFIY